ncbi:MAG: polymorphic toxin type 44 domain-containing protein, partial [Bacteroidia bacterium]
FSFNGQEKDDEVAGEGNTMTAEFWEYDSRLGRRWNVDPLSKDFPWQSSYLTFNNNPISLIDPDGRAATSPGKTYDEETGEEIHDDKIDDKKVYIGTKTDGSDRKLVGYSDKLQDVTKKFNAQIAMTSFFFKKKDNEFKAKEGNTLGGQLGKFYNRLKYFQERVTDKGLFDLKQPGKGFSEAEIGRYSFYEGKLFRFDDYGNYNYGVAAKAFGFSETTAKFGAGINQFWKTFNFESDNSAFSGRGDVLNFGIKLNLNTQYIKNDWYPTNISGFSDDPKDTYMITIGFNKIN